MKAYHLLPIVDGIQQFNSTSNLSILPGEITFYESRGSGCLIEKVSFDCFQEPDLLSLEEARNTIKWITQVNKDITKYMYYHMLFFKLP